MDAFELLFCYSMVLLQMFLLNEQSFVDNIY